MLSSEYLVVLCSGRAGLEQGGDSSGGSTGLHDLAAANVHAHHGGEGRGGAGERQNSNSAAHHFKVS